MLRKNNKENLPIGPDDTDYHLDSAEKLPSGLQDALKRLKNAPRKQAEKFIGDAWATFNIGAGQAEHWYVELLDQTSVYHANREEYDEAERYSERAYKKLANKPDKHHLERARVLRNWSQISIATENYDSAMALTGEALLEHERDIDSHRSNENALAKGLRHRAITETYRDRALISNEDVIDGAAKARLLGFLDSHDPKILPSEIDRVVDFVEAHIDPSVRDRFPEMRSRELTLNPVKIGKAVAGKVVRVLPKF